MGTRTVSYTSQRQNACKKSIILLAIIFIATLFLQSLLIIKAGAESATQSYGYSRQSSIQPGGYSLGLSIVNGSDGSAYVLGSFYETVDFDPLATHSGNTDVLTSAGDADSFIVKYDTNGNYQYVITWGGSGFDSPEDLTIDNQDNVIVTGYYAGTSDFDPTAGVDNRVSNGGNDVYVIKFNAAGERQFSHTYGGSGNDTIKQARVTSDNSVVVSGNFLATVDFDPTAGVDNRVSNGGSDVFLAKYAANGTSEFTKTWGGSGFEFIEAVAIDNQNNIIVGGQYESTVDMDPGAGVENAVSNGLRDAYTVKFDASGAYIFSKAWGGTDFDAVRFLSVDNEDNLVLSGEYGGSVDFDPLAVHPGNSDMYTALANSDAYFVKLSSSGDYEFTRVWGTAGFDFPTQHHHTADDSIYWPATFTGNVTVNDAGATESYSNNGGLDIMLSKYSSNGVRDYTKTFGGTGNESVRSVVVDSAQRIHLGSYVASGSVDFNGSPSETDIKTGDTDSYAMTSYGQDGAYGGTLFWDGTGGYSAMEAASIDRDGNIFLAGELGSSSVDFNPFPGVDQEDTRGSTGTDMFVTKITQTYRQNIMAPSGATIKEVGSEDVADTGEEGVVRSDSAMLRLSTDAAVPLADIQADLTQDLDWSFVTFAVDEAAYKSFVHNLTSAPGAASTFALYVPKAPTDNAVGICPGAASLAAVSPSCSNLAYYNEASSNTTIETVSGKTYWKVAGLTGTGGFSTAQATGPILPGLPATGEQGLDYRFVPVLISMLVVTGWLLKTKLRRFMV